VGRILAVDLGSRRVGLAITDPLHLIASPFRTLAYRGDRRLLADLLGTIREQEVEEVVIGLPLREDGSDSPGCEHSRRLAGQLRERGVRAVLWDERYTSRMAEESLREMGLSRRRAPERVDRLAASHLLQDYLRSKGD
jgi:putative Holliday junction resolvase